MGYFIEFFQLKHSTVCLTAAELRNLTALFGLPLGQLKLFLFEGLTFLFLYNRSYRFFQVNW